MKPPSYSLWTSPQTSKCRGKTQLTFLFSEVIKSEVTGEFLPLPAFRLTPLTQQNHKNAVIQS